MSATDTTYLPIPVSDVDVAFGGKAMEILPPVSAIPEEFLNGSNEWSRFVSDWFFGSLKRYPAPREGIDFDLALRNLKCVIGSFQPKHEHKEAGAAYLASLWFSSPDGELIKAKRGGSMSARIPLCMAQALAPMAPPQSVVHQIVQEDDLLAADRARNANKAERLAEQNHLQAQRLQDRHQDAMEAATRGREWS